MVSRENSFVSESQRPVESESLPYAAISATRDLLIHLGEGGDPSPGRASRKVTESMTAGKDAQYRTYGIFQMTQLETLNAR